MQPRRDCEREDRTKVSKLVSPSLACFVASAALWRISCWPLMKSLTVRFILQASRNLLNAHRTPELRRTS